MALSIIDELVALATKPAAQTASEINAAAQPRDTQALLRNLLTSPAPAPAYNAPQMTVPGGNGFVLPPLDNAEMRSGNLPTWAEVPGQFITNLAPQAVDLAQAAAPFAEALASPLETGRAIAQRYVTGQDAGTNRERDAEVAKAVMSAIAQDPLGLDYIKQTYGTEAGLKKQLAENPAWALFDASMFIPGSAQGSAAMRAASTGGKTAKEAVESAFTRALREVPPKPEPSPTLLNKVIAEQDDAAARNLAFRPEMELGSASIDPDERLAFKQPKVPGWQALERNFGILNFKGTPTAETTLGDMDVTSLRAHIRDLRDRRFGNPEKGIPPATNKFDRAYYDRQISEAQQMFDTPSADFEGDFPIRWVRDPGGNTTFPFRYSRITEEHPNELGVSPPGVKPGTWRLTHGGKEWEWITESTPSSPDTVQREQMLGDTSAAQHAGHWTAQDPRDWGTRGWQWVQDTFNTRPGTTTAEHNAAMDAAVARGAFGSAAHAGFEPYLPFTEIPDQLPPMHAQDIPTGAFFNTFLEQQHLNAKLDAADIPLDVRMRLKMGGIARRPDRHQAMREAIALAPLDAARQGNLSIPDPRFHPDPNAPIWGQPIKPAEFTPNPFDPERQRFDVDNMTDEQLVAALRAPDTQLNLFGLHGFKSPWDKASRDAFKRTAPNVEWKNVPSTRLGRDESGINASYRLDLDGMPFFRKETTSFGNTKTEVAALEAGDIMGASVLPVFQDTRNSMVTPWVSGKTIARSADADAIIKGMSPAERDKQMLYEFLMADSDKHGNNYFVDTKASKIVGIDYGGALMGDEETMFRGNAFYRKMKEAIDYTKEPLDMNELSATLSKQNEIMQAFDNAGVDRRDLNGLLYRFKLLKDFADASSGRAPTIMDFELYMTNPRRGRR